MNDFKMVLIRVNHRIDCAQKLQNVLTEHGCIIKTRLGIHEAGETCGVDGLIVLQIVSDEQASTALMNALEEVNGVKAQLLVI